MSVVTALHCAVLRWPVPASALEPPLGAHCSGRQTNEPALQCTTHRGGRVVTGVRDGGARQAVGCRGVGVRACLVQGLRCDRRGRGMDGNGHECKEYAL